MRADQQPTAAATVPQLVERATAAGTMWADWSRARRAQALRAVADGLDTHRDELVAIAEMETHLPAGRLTGELTRTGFQLRLMADTAEDGDYLDIRIDHADPDWPMGAPRPDLRRTRIPLGPVVVFAASNFPFAFSVAGGDTASALAAGCPVIVKAHPGHPRLSAATGQAVINALRAASAPDGLLQVIYGREAGIAALMHPTVKAGSFTGSIPGGRALFDLACARPEPIPFYGELGSVNPVFVTPAADRERGSAIAEELIASFSLGAGQFCTKPGVVFLPRGSAIAAALSTAVVPPAAPMLNEAIREGFRHSLDNLLSHPDVVVLRGPGADQDGQPAPTVASTGIGAVLREGSLLLQECFGPAVLLVEYDELSQLLQVAHSLEGQLTATLVAQPDDQAHLGALIAVLATRAGRLLWNQWPTGVSVTYAQQHGGPYPATTAPATTSVGTAAIDRFTRPVAYQGFPRDLLPVELHDDSTVPQRTDGVLIYP